MLVVIYGLYHGLIFFPVLLSIIGPSSFDASQISSEIAINAEELQPQIQSKYTTKDECEKDASETICRNQVTDR